MPVFNVPIILYSDDTSGNQSKKWNKFDIWALQLAGLPRHFNAKMENIHFIAASNKVSAIALARPIVEDLKMLENGVRMFDAKLKQEVLVVCPVICTIHDNGRASEIVNHIGNTGNLFCRMCQVHYPQRLLTH